jgi:hypothetical protein
MTFEIFFAGVGATLLGTLVGAWISCRMTYDFQKRLLQQQLDFQKQQADADAVLRRKIYDEWIAVFTDFRNMVNTRAKQLGGRFWD